jgi:putative Mg2+ transporter-C (MgtC) family protein
MEFDPTTGRFWYEIGVSLLCGSIIGIERELRGKPTGMRTCVLICLGTAIFVRMGNIVATDQSDPTRVVGQVVTGIGFLGGGVILARGEVVTGVTTASVVWLLAAIGTMIGVGQFAAAVAVSGVAVGILVGFELLEKAIARLRPGGTKAKDALPPH